jgi:GPH family glycoside/pentoside/hexuronide:cation symporter
MSPGLGRSARAGFAAGAITGGVYTSICGLLLLPYLIDILGLAPMAASVVVVLPAIWIAIATPVAGRMSDAAAMRSQRRHRWVLRAGCALGVSFLATFSTPLGTANKLSALIAVVLLVASATAYAFFQSSYVAVGAELSHDPQERNLLMTWRVAVLATSVLGAGALAPAIQESIGGLDGYRMVGVVAGLTTAAGAVWFYRRTPSPHSQPVREADSRDAIGLREAWRHRGFRLLLVNYALQGVGTGCGLAGLVYVADNVLNAPAAVSFMFAAIFGGAALTVPLWERLARRYRKETCLVAGTLMYVTGSGLLCLVAVLPHVALYCLAGSVGIGYAALQVFPMSILADVSRVLGDELGGTVAGALGGIFTGVESLSLAVGAGVYAFILGVGQYSTAAADAGVLSSYTRSAIVVGFSLVPAGLLACSLLPLVGLRRSGMTSPAG